MSTEPALVLPFFGAEPEPWLDSHDVGRLFGLGAKNGPRTVRDWTKRERDPLPCHPLPPTGAQPRGRKRLRFLRSEVDAWLRRQTLEA